MSNEWDDMAGQWEEHPLVGDYARKAYKSLEEVIELKGLRILDFGCGTGLLSELMYEQAMQIVGLDTSEEMIEVFRKKEFKNIELLTAELTPELRDTHPALNEKFDLIVASSVCSFLPDYPVTLTVLASMLNDNGAFVQWDWLAEQEEVPNALSREQIKAAFKTANLDLKALSVPFIMAFDDSQMPVVMAVGHKD